MNAQTPITVQPTYWVDTQRWVLETETGTVEAKTLRELQAKLTYAVHIDGYYPNGFVAQRDGFLDPRYANRRPAVTYTPNKRAKAAIESANERAHKIALTEARQAQAAQQAYSENHRTTRERERVAAFQSGQTTKRNFVNHDAVLDLYKSGKAAFEIAQQLGHAINTVERHIREGRVAGDPRATRARKIPVYGINQAWTDAEIDKLRELAEVKKLKTHAIARELGRKRNSVIGKCHRLGITLHHPNFRDGGAATQRAGRYV